MTVEPTNDFCTTAKLKCTGPLLPKKVPDNVTYSNSKEINFSENESYIKEKSHARWTR